MSGLSAALRTEALKFRCSKAAWISGAAFTLVPVISGLFMFVLQDPTRARQLGLLGTKAQGFSGAADWTGFFALMGQATALGGFLIFGVVVTWLFGREFNDHTITDLLALPTSRPAIVAAKFLVAGTWILVLLVVVLAAALAIGAGLQLDGWSARTAQAGALGLIATGAMTFAVTTPVALVASVGRGYLPAVGAIFVALLLAQVLSVLGWGPLFPWAVPGLFAGAAGPEVAATVGPGSIALVAITGLAGAVATAAHWRSADQH